MLSQEQIAHYDDQGFLVLDRVIPGETLARLRQAARDIVADFDVDRHRAVFKTTDRDAGRDDYFFDSAESVHCFLEEGALDENGELNRPKELAVNKIGHALHDLVPEFTGFCRLPLFGEVLRDLGNQRPLLWQTMYIFKPPGIGGEVRWHQDASYLVTAPPSVTGIWVALEDASTENSCLWVQPGQHRTPLRELYTVDWASRAGTLETLDETPWETGKAVPVEVPAGSVVVFHDHMPHHSSQNFSDRSRHALTLHVSDGGTDWLEGNWLQRPRLGAFQL